MHEIKKNNKKYQSPAEILKDQSLSEEEKVKILKDWESDEKALLRADDEYMIPQNGDDTQISNKLIEKIQRAERKLDESPSKKL